MLSPFKSGILLGLSLIISIGAQNLFLIKQGLKKEFPFIAALLCFFADLGMILLGVTSNGIAVYSQPTLQFFMLFAGAVFLFIYGTLSLKKACNPAFIGRHLQNLQDQADRVPTLKRIVLLALSFSLLNPQAILDTMVIIGSNANHYVDSLKTYFVFGAIIASLLWFFTLAISSYFFSKKLMTVRFWQILEAFSGVTMFVFGLRMLGQLCWNS